MDAQGCHTNSKTGDRHCHRTGGSTPKPSSGLVSGHVTLVSVGDGDTARVTSRQGKKVTIRLACIDAPETSQGTSGKWSTQTLKRLIQGKSISLKPQVKDRYGRTVAEIYVGSRNINLEMVQVGAAYVYRQYLKQCDRDAYLSAENAATKKGLGVWVRTNQPNSLGVITSTWPGVWPWSGRKTWRRRPCCWGDACSTCSGI